MKKILTAVAILAIAFAIFYLGNTSKMDDSFKARIDSLHQVNDSLMAENLKDDSVITSLADQNEILAEKAKHQKVKVVKIREEVGKQQVRIDSFKAEEVVTFFNEKYPKDTVTNPLPIAKPVLISAAKDLVAYEGAKQEIAHKDTIISINESMLTKKDSIIAIFGNKEVRYKGIISNKDLAIAEWSRQYNALELKHKKFQLKSKFQRIGFSLVVGALAYTLIVK